MITRTLQGRTPYVRHETGSPRNRKSLHESGNREGLNTTKDQQITSVIWYDCITWFTKSKAKSDGEVRKGRSPIVEVVIHHCTWKEGSDTNTASPCVGLWLLPKHGIAGNNIQLWYSFQHLSAFCCWACRTEILWSIFMYIAIVMNKLWFSAVGYNRIFFKQTLTMHWSFYE